MNKLIDEEVSNFNGAISEMYKDMDKVEFMRSEYKYSYLSGYIKGFLERIKSFSNNIDYFNEKEE